MSVVLSVYPPLGLLVVDCDLKLDIDGRWNYIDFLTSHGLERPPDTFMVETPTRGMHLYHRVPEGQPIATASASSPPASILELAVATSSALAR